MSTIFNNPGDPGPAVVIRGPRKPLQPTPGWTMPEPPVPGLVPVAILIEEDDVWDMYWVDPKDDDTSEYWESGDGYGPTQIPWPFNDEVGATTEDMQRAGFTCE